MSGYMWMSLMFTFHPTVVEISISNCPFANSIWKTHLYTNYTNPYSKSSKSVLSLVCPILVNSKILNPRVQNSILELLLIPTFPVIPSTPTILQHCWFFLSKYLLNLSTSLHPHCQPPLSNPLSLSQLNKCNSLLTHLLISTLLLFQCILQTGVISNKTNKKTKTTVSYLCLKHLSYMHWQGPQARPCLLVTSPATPSSNPLLVSLPHSALYSHSVLQSYHTPSSLKGLAHIIPFAWKALLTSPVSTLHLIKSYSAFRV